MGNWWTENVTDPVSDAGDKLENATQVNLDSLGDTAEQWKQEALEVPFEVIAYGSNLVGATTRGLQNVPIIGGIMQTGTAAKYLVIGGLALLGVVLVRKALD